MLLTKLWKVRGLLVATGVALGLGLPLGKLAVGAGVGPLSFALLPALGAALLLAWRQHGHPNAPGRLLRFGLVPGLLGNAIPNTLTAWLAYTAGAGFTGLAYTLPPAFTLGMLLALRLERWHMLRALAVGVGMLGALWLVAALCGGAFLWSLLAWLMAPATYSDLAWEGMPYLLVQIPMAALSAALFFLLQTRTEPVTMSFVGYVITLTAEIAGALVLDERLPLQLLPAAALIGIGFWLIQQAAPTVKQGAKV